jgi:hypothetical protein
VRDALTVRRALRLAGRTTVPGDKSITHRAYLFALLARGTTRVTGANEGRDCEATLRAIARLGAEITRDPDGVKIAGTAGRLREPDLPIDLENSGTAMRLLLGAVAPSPVHVVLTGDASLRGRPMARVATPLREMGAAIDGREGGTLPPLSIRGGRLRGINTASEPSAQVKSALPRRSEGGGNGDPRASRDHTERMLPVFGGCAAPAPGGPEPRAWVSVTGAAVWRPGGRPRGLSPPPSSWSRPRSCLGRSHDRGSRTEPDVDRLPRDRPADGGAIDAVPEPGRREDAREPRGSLRIWR